MDCFSRTGLRGNKPECFTEQAAGEGPEGMTVQDLCSSGQREDSCYEKEESGQGSDRIVDRCDCAGVRCTTYAYFNQYDRGG